MRIKTSEGGRQFWQFGEVLEGEIEVEKMGRKGREFGYPCGDGDL